MRACVCNCVCACVCNCVCVCVCGGPRPRVGASSNHTSSSPIEWCGTARHGVAECNAVGRAWHPGPRCGAEAARRLVHGWQDHQVGRAVCRGGAWRRGAVLRGTSTDDVASRPLVGSSRNSNTGSATSSSPMDTRLSWPPDTPRFSGVPTTTFCTLRGRRTRLEGQSMVHPMLKPRFCTKRGQDSCRWGRGHHAECADQGGFRTKWTRRPVSLWAMGRGAEAWGSWDASATYGPRA